MNSQRLRGRRDLGGGLEFGWSILAGVPVHEGEGRLDEGVGGVDTNAHGCERGTNESDEIDEVLHTSPQRNWPVKLFRNLLLQASLLRHLSSTELVLIDGK